MKRHFKYRAEWLPRKWLKRLPRTGSRLLAKELSTSDTVLDLGCGPYSPLRAYNVLYSVGVEIFGPYIEEAKKLDTHNEYIRADVTTVEFKPASFDVVIAFHLLEHLDKEQGYKLIATMKTWAREKVIILLPNGHTHHQHEDDNEFQIHRYGYNVDELRKLGFHVYGTGLKLPGLHGLMSFFAQVATYPLGMLTYNHPKLSKNLTALYKHKR